MPQIRPWVPDAPGFSTVQERSQVTAKDVAALLKRYWTIILIVLACCAGSTYIVLSLLTEQFDTKASVIVKMGRENLDPPSDARNPVFSTGVRHEEVMSEIEMVKSPALLEEVVDELGADTFKPLRVPPPGLIGHIKFYIKAVLRFGKEQYKNLLYAMGLKRKLDDHQAAVDELTRDLSATWQKETDVFEVSLRMPDPVLGNRVLTQLLHDYLMRRIEVRNGAGLHEFISQESSQLKEQLDRTEKEEDDWKTSHNISSVKEELPLHLQRIRDLSAEHDQTMRDLQTAEKQRENLLAQLRDTPENLRGSQQDVPSPVAQSYRQHLTMLQSERAELLGKYKDNSVVVISKDEEIARVQALLRNEEATQTSEVTTMVNPVRQELQKRLNETETAIAGLTARSAAQVDQLGRLQSEQQQFDAAGDHLRDLERSRDLLETEYLSIAKRAEDSDVNAALNSNHISNVSIISPAWSDPEPAYPRKMLLMYVSLGVGLVIGIVFALVLHYLDDDVHEVDEVREIRGVPCLGVIPAETDAAESEVPQVA
jgi:uncharacterized protein involved in exopolysaccharide biosynthesis